MGLYIKGNPQPGEYKLIKTTDGWVLEGKHIAYNSIVLDLEHDEDLIEFMNRFNVYYQTKRIITEIAENLGINIEDDFGEKAGEWISVKKRLPKVDKPVLITAKDNNYEYVCVGKWVEKYSVEDYGENFEFTDYNEENDTYYCPEGWYECIHNWDDYSDVFIYDEVIAWRPLPKPYEMERSK